MKAVILAGGEGTRLQPLTLLNPKPMIPLFDKPLLEHIVNLLKNNGFTEICMTLRYLPKVIQDRFGSGKDYGVWIEYRIESEPRGTAGSVRDCADFIDGDDFLVISGDAACSFDLRAFYEKHRISGAEATILTHECDDPLEYGLVLTAQDGSVRSFLEKPQPEKLCTNRVNTGIYAFSSRILSEIPESGAFDFGSDLFPKLLHDNRRLCIWQPDGYWNDIGSPEAYLQTCRDVLDGKFPLLISGDIRQKESLPFWVSPGAEVSPSAQIGPYSVICAGSRIGPECNICGSVINGAVLEGNVKADESIISQNVYISPDVTIEAGTVLADNIRIGRGCRIQEGVKINPNIRLGEQQTVSKSLSKNVSSKPLKFSENSILKGTYGLDVLPDMVFALGTSHFSASRVAASASGGNAALLLAESFLLSCGCMGREVFLLDATSPASAAFIGPEYGIELMLFVLQDVNTIKFFFFDENGLPISRQLQRQLCASNFQCFPLNTKGCHIPHILLGSEERIISLAASRNPKLNTACVSVFGSDLLKECLQKAGIKVVPPADGIIHFHVSRDGFSLSAIDERGKSWAHSNLICAYTAICFSEGEKTVFLPSSAPYSTEEIAARFGGRISIVDSGTTLNSEQFYQYHYSQNAILLCMKLLLSLNGFSNPVKLSDLMDSLPCCFQKEAILETKSNGISVLRMLTESEEAKFRDSICFPKDHGVLKLQRLARNRIRILAESSQVEYASELCETYTHKLKAFDSHLQKSNSYKE